jgi:hypothetical protein
MRTDGDVMTRVGFLEGPRDMFGWRREVLIQFGLSFEFAEKWRSNEATLESWGVPSDERTRQAASKYLKFAMGKASDHRGVSASRSVDKLMEFAWLLGNETLQQDMERSQDFKQYGAPLLKAFAVVMDMIDVCDANVNAVLARMATGEKCDDLCMEGCEE